MHVIVNCVTSSNSKHDKPTIITIIKYGILLVACGTIAGVTGHFYEDATKSIFDLFGYVFLVLLLLLKILGDLQYVYVASGLTRNPFYIKSSTSVDRLKQFQCKIGYLGHIYDVLLSYSTSF